MSRWHREHPELTGTDADPWMAHEDYRRALEDVRRAERTPPPTRAMIEEAERNSSHRCTDRDCGQVQAEGATCVDCGAPLTENDY